MSDLHGRGKSEPGRDRVDVRAGFAGPHRGLPSTTVDSWIRLFAAVSGFAGLLVLDIAVAALFLVLMVRFLPPPGVTWRPVGFVPVLIRYVPFAILWVAFVTGFMRLMEAFGHQILPQQELQSLPAMEGIELLGRLILVVVIAPVTEEILFRGYLFTALSRTIPIWPAHLVTAALFGCLHGLDYAVPIGVLSLFFGYLRQRYGSLLPSILAHAVHNGVTVGIVMTWPYALDLFHNR